MLDTVREKLVGHTPREVVQALLYRTASVPMVMEGERRVALRIGQWQQKLSSQTGDATLIIGTAGNGNIGDQAMFEATIAAVDGPVIAFVQGHYALTVPEAAKNRVEMVDLSALVNGGVWSAQRARIVFSRYVGRAARLIVIGADIMDGGYQPREAALRLLCLELADAAGLDCRIVGFSWSTDPNPYVVRRFRTLPRSIRRYARDRISSKRMTVDGIAGVESVADVVFAHAITPQSSNFSDWVGRESIGGRPLAVVNVSGLVLKRLMREGRGDSYLREMTETVRKLVARGYSVVLLPHVIRAGDDDLVASRQVSEQLHSERVLVVDRLLSPAEVLAIVKCSDVVISARMHLGILALSTERPAVLFDTQGKVEGLMAEFGLSACVLSPAECAAETLLAMVDHSRGVAEQSDAVRAGRERMRKRAECNFSGLFPASGHSHLRSFADTAELQTHSGIYPVQAVAESPTLTRRGEYSDPRVADHSLEKYAHIAALGPVRDTEDRLASVLFSEQQDIVHHPDIGWYNELLTGHVIDDDERRASSSGGLATALLVSLFQSGEITGVIHVCHSDSGPLFEYRISRSVEEIRYGARTKYYPGSLFAALEEIRITEGRYAVVGIPSFISELRRLENIEPLLKERIVVHVGLVCGHQKTANYATYLAWQAGISPGDLVDIDFRAKVPGKLANEYSTIFRFRNHAGHIEEKLVDQAQLEGTNWGLSMFKSSFSDYSDDAFNETADVVFGDAWLPRFMDDYLGTNIVIVRDRRLGTVLSDLALAGVIELSECSDSDVVRSQSSLVTHSRREMNYRLAWFKRKNWPIPTLQRDLPPQPSVDLFRQGIQRQRARISRRSHEAFVDAMARESLSRFTLRMIPLTFHYRIVDRTRRFYKRLPSLAK